MKILLAEDDATNALLLERTLKKGGYEVELCRDGAEALAALQRERCDALLTDWMMPNIDGIELTRRVRATVEPQPLIMIVTALASEEARMHALEAGADDYLAKPVNPKEVLERLANCFRRRAQPKPVVVPRPSMPAEVRPPFVGVVLAASTGGPKALLSLVRQIPKDSEAAYFIALHGPAWLLSTFVNTLQRETPLPIALAEEGARVRSGEIYVAPGDRHLLVEGPLPRLRLSDSAPENFARPAADPLFRSAAHTFGRYCVGVVLTGMGRDGSLGAAAVAAAGGTVLVETPETAVAPSMPKTAIELGVASRVIPLDKMASAIGDQVDQLARALASAAD